MSDDTEPPKSVRDELRDRFQSLDGDGDGRLNRQEFGALLDGLGAALSEAEADHAFSDIDADSNGAIDFDEFCRFWRLEA